MLYPFSFSMQTLFLTKYIIKVLYFRWQSFKSRKFKIVKSFVTSNRCHGDRNWSLVTKWKCLSEATPISNPSLSPYLVPESIDFSIFLPNQHSRNIDFDMKGWRGWQIDRPSYVYRSIEMLFDVKRYEQKESRMNINATSIIRYFGNQILILSMRR